MKRSLLAAAVLVAFVVSCGDSSATTGKKKKAEPSTATQKPPVSTAAAEPARRPNVVDAFAVGATFKGERSIVKAAHQPIRLVVTKREGADFEGELTLGEKSKTAEFKVKVTGKATVGDGMASFSTEKVDKFQPSFTGFCVDGKFTFECRGETRNGKSSEGKGVLTREK